MEQWIADMEGQMASEDLGKDLISVNILIKKHAVRMYMYSGGKCHLQGPSVEAGIQCTVYLQWYAHGANFKLLVMYVRMYIHGSGIT